MKLFKLQFQKQGLQKVLLFCFSLVVAFALCEGALQLVLRSIQGAGHYIWPPHIKTVFKPSPDVMPGVSGDSEFITNSQGLRGDELAAQHTYRILAVGGSTTICGYLDQSETWPQLLQETLNRHMRNQEVWVGNGGVSGLTTRHHLVALQYLPLKELKIDAVILLAGVNDFSKRLSHDKDYDPDFLERPAAKNELLAQTFTGTYDTYSEDPLYKRTATWQLLRRTKRLMSKEHVEDVDGKIYIIWREHRRHAAEIRDELPDLSSALGEYARNINRMIDVAQEKSVRLIFMTQPAMWKSELPQNLEALLWLGGIGDFQKESGKPYYSAAALEKGMKAYNDTLLRICRERRIECLDLASMLEKDTTVFYDDVHFNEGGARKVAETLSRYMLDRSPFREAPFTEKPVTSLAK
jgi:lysophospholipase L1-like esterase